MTIGLLANIDVDDLEQAIELYRDALGLRLGRRFSGSVAEMLEASSAIYLLAKPAGGPSMAVSVNCASQIVPTNRCGYIKIGVLFTYEVPLCVALKSMTN